MRVSATHELVIPGDRDELARVVENLIENALKYGGSGKLVEVGVAREDTLPARSAEAVLTVRDHGPGIEPRHLPRLTERFYRAGGTSSGGTGLGLAIVKHIVNRHRGRMSIESELGRGATFRVMLPLQR
jgi:two-component system phosphate regulon sensor histidine kinase PhoR